MQSSKQGMWKEYLFREKWYIKCKGVGPHTRGILHRVVPLYHMSIYFLGELVNANRGPIRFKDAILFIFCLETYYM